MDDGRSVDDAPAYIFGVTAGNDVSERTWQQADLQWLRAKASDTFGPIGPAIVTGLDYRDLLIETHSIFDPLSSLFVFSPIPPHSHTMEKFSNLCTDQ